MYLIFFKKIFDISLAIILSFLLIWLFTIIFILIKLDSPGPAVFWTKRVGKENEIFLMPKFRTMYIGTPEVATSNLKNPEKFITRVGKFLRNSSLDEIPQIISILQGKMSFVGPRPALFNQYDLIELRDKIGINEMLPGITGWAQINGRDNLNSNEKVKFDEEYKEKVSILFDIKIIFLTVFKVLKKNNISH